jgi:hypothetical protein
LSYETAVQQWRAGQRRLEAASPAERRVLERVVEAIVNELRRRLGGKFTVDELAELYDRGTGWCLGVAVSVAPDDPQAWAADTVCDAAFARYQREATDYAGGRRLS